MTTAHPALAACGFLDYTCQISQSITGWFASLVQSAINPLLGIIGQDLLSTPQPGSFPAVTGMWGTSLAIADAAYVLLVLAGGILVMGYETVQVSTSAKEITPRLGLGLAAANLSLILTSHAVSLANGLAAALAGQGASPQSAGAALANTIRNSISTGGIFLILLALVAVILALVLAVTYVLRLMAVILLTAVAPLALACYALPQTAWAGFQNWCRDLTCSDDERRSQGHHGHPCPCACSTSSSSGSAAGWSCSAGHRPPRTPSCSCCGTRSPCCAAPIRGPGSTGPTAQSSPR